MREHVHVSSVGILNSGGHIGGGVVAEEEDWIDLLCPLKDIEAMREHINARQSPVSLQGINHDSIDKSFIPEKQ